MTRPTYGSAPRPIAGPDPHKAEILFSRSQEGRQYHNGIVLHPGRPPKTDEVRHYFHDYHFYPWYGSHSHPQTAHHSPFSFYVGVCPPYIAAEHCVEAAPAVEYVDAPVYMNDVYDGWSSAPQEPVPTPQAVEETPDSHYRTLRAAIDELRLAFVEGNIEPLVNLVDPHIRIAVYLRGKYAYSLPVEDYLDLTRDALRNMRTIAFRIERVTPKAPGVFAVSGTHVYRGTDNQPRTVYVSFVLEIRDGFWTLTQVGSAPDRIREW